MQAIGTEAADRGVDGIAEAPSRGAGRTSEASAYAQDPGSIPGDPGTGNRLDDGVERRFPASVFPAARALFYVILLTH